MNEYVRYREKKFGIAVLGMAAVLLMLIIAFLLIAPHNVVLWAAAALVVFTTLLFYGLQFSITSHGIIVSWGIGFFSEEVDFTIIKTVFIGPNESMKSWPYSPLATEVVVVTLRDETKVYLPTDEPKRVLELIRFGMETKR